jgi:SAM-dependent methyltransferase
MNQYTKEYYSSSNYASYSERGERYAKLAKETTQLLTSIGLISKQPYILDYGCATGHLIQGLKDLGYAAVEGIDISDFARQECTKKRFRVFKDWNEWSKCISSFLSPNLVYALDVLEHMTVEEVLEFLEMTRNSTLVIRIPVASIVGESFHLEVSRKDPTHINCRTKHQWEQLIERIRPNCKILRLNLNTIYDSEGVFCALIV